MPAIPRDMQFDSSLALLADPYGFIARRCRQQGTDVFETRLLLQRTLCLYGAQMAELFYDPQRFQRQGAAPEPLRATLFGKGGVQGLDGSEHRHRKALFMDIVAPASVARLAGMVADEWLRRAHTWAASGGRVVLYSAMQEVLAQAVCRWAGVPLAEADLPRRSAQLATLFDKAGAVGGGHLRSRLARLQTERWLGDLVQALRAGRSGAVEHSALQAIARHRDLEGNLLPARIAAVELLNLLRPIQAVSVFIVFIAHALHEHPQYREALRQGDPQFTEYFIQEVRRWYPFFPAVAARVRERFDWNGYCFPAGVRVLLDLHGTNHDPRIWDAPEQFRPERFLDHTPTAFEFIPQGGADAQTNHRCPGEGIAVALMKVAVDILVNRLHYQTPVQDLRIDYTRLPALPHDHFILERVRLKE